MDIMEQTQRFSRTVPCPNCGEEYSVTYKRCPFCGGPPKKTPKAPEPEAVPYAPSEEIFRAMLQEEEPAVGEGGAVPPKFPQGVHPEARQIPASRSREEAPRPSMETVVISVGKGKAAAEPEPAAPQTASPAASQAAPQAVSQAAPRVVTMPASAAAPQAATSAAAPVKSTVAVLPREIDIELPELDFSDIDTVEVSTPSRGGKRLQGKGRGGGTRGGRKGGGAGRVIGFLFSLLIVAAAVYIVAIKAAPYIQTFLEERGLGITLGQGEKEGEGSAADPAGEPEQVVFQLTDAQVTLTAKDATQTLVPVFEGTQADPEIGALTWKSSNPAVVTVTADGKLTAVSKGDAIVSVTRENGDMANCQVVCAWEEGEVIPSSLYLNKDDFTLYPGESFTMKVIGTDAPVTWSIDKPNVATISETGLVKYVSHGTAIITCKIGTYSITGIVRCT